MNRDMRKEAKEAIDWLIREYNATDPRDRYTRTEIKFDLQMILEQYEGYIDTDLAELVKDILTTK